MSLSIQSTKVQREFGEVMEQEALQARLQAASVVASARAAHLSDEEVDTLIEQARQEVYEVATT